MWRLSAADELGEECTGWLSGIPSLDQLRGSELCVVGGLRAEFVWSRVSLILECLFWLVLIVFCSLENGQYCFYGFHYSFWFL